MEILHALEDSRRACTSLRAGGEIGLVPTMGALHAGHISLVERAARENQGVVVTVFVNPLQFGAHEDLDNYPRDEAGDAALLRQAGANLVLFLSTDEMYPPGHITRLSQGDLSCTLEGAARPDHFDGVLTVVCKLFQLVGPQRAYFGHKDFQQSVAIQRMVRDLDMPVEVVVCPTLRDADGLALSSRNAYLSEAERREGLNLVASLAAANTLFEAGERSTCVLEAALREILLQGLQRPPDYAALVRPLDFSHPSTAEAGDVLVVAAPVGPTRLLDNHALGAKLAAFSAHPQKPL